MREFNGRSLLLFVFSGMMLLLVGCTSVQLVSNYDETIDTEAQQLQKKFDAYFISLQSASPEDLKYKNQQKFYQSALVDLDAMEVRAGGIYKNNLTIEQIGLVKENLAYLVLLHKKCITKPLSDEQRKMVKMNGIDLSMDCRVENGATADVKNRGDIAINVFVVAPVKNLFNQQLGAVMALELAKKRGETK